MCIPWPARLKLLELEGVKCTLGMNGARPRFLAEARLSTASIDDFLLNVSSGFEPLEVLRRADLVCK
jgi:hypothetical protein